MSSDPGNSDQVWNIAALLKGWWLAFAAPTFPAALATWYFTRRDTASERRGKARDAEAEREAAERVRQDAVDAAQIARYQAEIDRLYARLETTEKVALKARRDADDGWWLGRYWQAELSRQNAIARQYRHDMDGHISALRSYISVMQSLLRVADLTMPAGIEMPTEIPQLDLPHRVPGVEEPLAKG